MNFQNKLHTVVSRMGISNAQLARAAGLDPSLISRFRTGERVPSQHSRQIQCLCDGLLLLAKQLNCRSLVHQLCGAPADADDAALYDFLSRWFHADDSMLKNQRRPRSAAHEPRKKGAQLKDFDKKLELLMDTLGISSIRLARFLNVDPSLVSRFRTGMRKPSADSRLISEICTYFSTHIKANHQIGILSEILDLPENVEQADYASTVERCLLAWFGENREEFECSAMGSFLEKLDSFGEMPDIPAAPLQGISGQDRHLSSLDSFWGTEGLRKAVILFLSSVATSQEPRTLYLYSDQSLSWLTENTAFMQTWSSLMFAVLSKRNRIKIIHNVDRDLHEMFSAIENWLPLYMTGLIEPYFCRHVGDSRFARTMFVAPELCSVTSSCVAGTENTAEYLFCTGPGQVSYHRAQFEALLSTCSPLMQIFNSHSADFYMLRLKELEQQGTRVTSLLPTLSLSTMPEDLLEKILCRSTVPANIKKRIIRYHSGRRHSLFETLSGGSVTEIAPAFNNEFVLFGRARIGLPGLLLSEPLFYRKEEYAQHLQSIDSLAARCSGYRFCPLPSGSFHNIEIMVRQGSTVVSKNDRSPVSFVFTHPLMCRAFKSYLDTLAGQCVPAPENRRGAEPEA